MNAEALLRGGTATLGHTAPVAGQLVREKRTTSPAWTGVTPTRCTTSAVAIFT
jgi:hypothetical protein